MSALVSAKQFDAKGKRVRMAQVWVNRATLSGKPTGNVTMIVTLGARQVFLEMTPDDWYALNQAAWAAPATDDPANTDAYDDASARVTATWRASSERES